MGRCYVPSDGPVAWQTFLADPAEQWKTGYSAKTLLISGRRAIDSPTRLLL